MDCYNSVPFNHDDLENAVAMLLASRERSDERSIFEARHGWRESTAALDDPHTENDYPSDFAMQLAIVGNHKEFLNPHWRYRRPWCYTTLFGAFIPFDFGSTVAGGEGKAAEQIFFIEGAPFLAERYANFTGIDANDYVGMKIVSINGVEPGEYFRQWGRNVYRFDSNDGAMLNEVLGHGAYSVRVSTTHDVPPDHGSDTFVLERKNGTQTTVEMPWVFAPRSAFGLGQDPLYYAANDETFRQFCSLESQTYRVFGTEAAADADIDAQLSEMMLDRQSASAAELEFAKELTEVRSAIADMRRKNNGPKYFELPPGQANQSIETIVPKSDGAVVKQLSDRVTIIRLSSFVDDWKEEVIAGTNYACGNSDRIILDMRGNGGGYVSQIEWLTTHFFPDRSVPADYSVFGSYRGDSAARQELAERMTIYTDAFPWMEGCWFGYESQCHLYPDTGVTLPKDYHWMESAQVVEERGGVLETLTRQVSFKHWYEKYRAGTDTIACPGTFQNDSLIILSDGTGASAGYFFPEVIRNQALVVTMGGFLGEPLVSGIARGGAVWSMNGWEAWIEQLLAKYTIHEPPTDPLPILRRDVETYIEQPAVYLSNRTDLHVDHEPRGDIHLDIWADAEESDAYVYSAVAAAAQSVKRKRK